MAWLLLFISFSVFTFLLIGNKKTFRLMSFSFITRKFHLSLLIGLTAILLVMTILIEVIYPDSDQSGLQHRYVGNESSIVKEFEAVENAILAGKKPDTPLLAASRTHSIGNKLELIHANDGNNAPILFIEKSDALESVVEELIYKPFTIINDYDFTDNVELALPIWSDSYVTIPNMIQLEVNLVRFIDESIFNQFTSHRQFIQNSGGFGSFSSAPMIHLIVPSDLEIIDPFDSVYYINE